MIWHQTRLVQVTAWMSTLSELCLTLKNLPRDVSTRWNSTYNMLECALKYWVGIDVITDKHKLELSSYGLSEKEWDLLEQLHDVLKVRGL